ALEISEVSEISSDWHHGVTGAREADSRLHRTGTLGADEPGLQQSTPGELSAPLAPLPVGPAASPRATPPGRSPLLPATLGASPRLSVARQVRPVAHSELVRSGLRYRSRHRVRRGLKLLRERHVVLRPRRFDEAAPAAVRDRSDRDHPVERAAGTDRHERPLRHPCLGIHAHIENATRKTARPPTPWQVVGSAFCWVLPRGGGE